MFEIVDVAVMNTTNSWTKLGFFNLYFINEVVVKKTLPCIIRYQQLTQSRSHSIRLCAYYRCACFTQHIFVINVNVTDRKTLLISGIMQVISWFYPVVGGISLQQHLLFTWRLEITWFDEHNFILKISCKNFYYHINTWVAKPTYLFSFLFHSY